MQLVASAKIKINFSQYIFEVIFQVKSSDSSLWKIKTVNDK